MCVARAREKKGATSATWLVEKKGATSATWLVLKKNSFLCGEKLAVFRATEEAFWSIFNSSERRGRMKKRRVYGDQCLLVSPPLISSLFFFRLLGFLNFVGVRVRIILKNISQFFLFFIFLRRKVVIAYHKLLMTFLAQWQLKFIMSASFINLFGVMILFSWECTWFMDRW